MIVIIDEFDDDDDHDDDNDDDDDDDHDHDDDSVNITQSLISPTAAGTPAWSHLLGWQLWTHLERDDM